jgi:hypothetical protein
VHQAQPCATMNLHAIALTLPKAMSLVPKRPGDGSLWRPVAAHGS